MFLVKRHVVESVGCGLYDRRSNESKAIAHYETTLIVIPRYVTVARLKVLFCSKYDVHHDDTTFAKRPEV